MAKHFIGDLLPDGIEWRMVCMASDMHLQIAGMWQGLPLHVSHTSTALTVKHGDTEQVYAQDSLAFNRFDTYRYIYARLYSQWEKRGKP